MVTSRMEEPGRKARLAGSFDSEMSLSYALRQHMGSSYDSFPREEGVITPPLSPHADALLNMWHAGGEQGQ
jgi:hypothetical protein